MEMGRKGCEAIELAAHVSADMDVLDFGAGRKARSGSMSHKGEGLNSLVVIGTGILAIMFAQKVKSVLAIDAAPSMIDVGYPSYLCDFVGPTRSLPWF